MHHLLAFLRDRSFCKRCFVLMGGITFGNDRWGQAPAVILEKKHYIHLHPFTPILHPFDTHFTSILHPFTPIYTHFRPSIFHSAISSSITPILHPSLDPLHPFYTHSFSSLPGMEDFPFALSAGARSRARNHYTHFPSISHPFYTHFTPIFVLAGACPSTTNPRTKIFLSSPILDLYWSTENCLLTTPSRSPAFKPSLTNVINVP